MSDPRQSESDRLVELETRLAFQEHALNELSQVMHEQRREIDMLRRTVERFTSDLQSLRHVFAADPASEPPPPHY